MNTELFKKIHDIISVQPEGFSMDSWESRDEVCGTTRCIAGWAIYLTTNQPLTNPRISGRSASVYDLADRLGVDAYLDVLGARLLGLSGWQSSLFYVSDGRAKEFVRLAAEGDDSAALRLLDD